MGEVEKPALFGVAVIDKTVGRRSSSVVAAEQDQERRCRSVLGNVGEALLGSVGEGAAHILSGGLPLGVGQGRIVPPEGRAADDPPVVPIETVAP